ncbi:MAG: flagellar basal body L-ring protein FlgH [Proteobacteria bacterium]|nr:flagellar basal body L-ring protein FlgH [Pseudomonadota bacterium]
MKTMSIMALALVALSGCALAPDTIVQRPTTARPAEPVASRPANGTIFQAASYRPMFEDRRARLVGDVLTMTIVEKTSASKNGANSGGKSSSANGGVTSLFGLPATTLGKFNAAANSTSKYDQKDTESSSNAFTGTVAVTVIEVLPNGNLVVSGEKQVSMDKGTEFVRVSGVVNPDQIALGNNISSTQVADARIEYRTNSHIDKTELFSMMARFFLSVLPL